MSFVHYCPHIWEILSGKKDQDLAVPVGALEDWNGAERFDYLNSQVQKGSGRLGSKLCMKQQPITHRGRGRRQGQRSALQDGKAGWRSEKF